MNFFDILQNKAGVLGMNTRNVSFTRPANSRKARRIADSKLRTKRYLKAAGLPVPKTFAVIHDLDELKSFDWEKLPKSFVLKPNRGTHGQGILLVYGKSRSNNHWIGTEGKRVTISDLKTHIAGILEGKFSMGNAPDIAFFEERIKPNPNLKPFFYKGLPDVRVLVYNQVPVMAAIRLPTKSSGGKANVHAGAMYAGLDMATGISTQAVVRKTYSLIPDTYNVIERTVDPPHTELKGIKIPKWTKVLKIAVEAQIATGLGYAGVDITLDRDKGPVILELNARPGLAIQHANLDGLKARLERVRGLKIKTADRGVSVGKSLFGGEIEEEVEGLTGKQVIGLIEKVKLYGLPYEKKTRKKKNIKMVRRVLSISAKIDTGASRTSIDEKLMRRLGYSDAIDYFNSFNYPVFNTLEEAKAASRERDEKIEKGLITEHPMIQTRALTKSGTGITIRPVLPVTLSISGIKLHTTATVIDRSDLDYKIIIGSEDLRNFIIDPTKKRILELEDNITEENNESNTSQ